MKLNEDLLGQAKENNIHLFIINVTNKNKMSNLRKMIIELGGWYYNTENEEMIGDSILHAYELVMSGIDMKDTDQDGIYDMIEKKGFRISNGQLQPEY